MNRAIFELMPARIPDLDANSYVQALAIIVGLSEPNPVHAPLIAALKRLTELHLPDQPDLVALADWWRVVGAGQEAAGSVYELPADIADSTREFLERTRDSAPNSTSEPLLASLVRRRRLDRAIAELSDVLELSSTATTKFAGEDHAWEELVGELRGAVERVSRGEPGVDLPELDEADARRLMKKYGVVTGSPRYKYLLRRVGAVREARDAVATIRRPTDGRRTDPAITIDTVSARRDEMTPLLRALAVVVAPIIEDDEHRIAGTAHELEAAAAAAGSAELDWLACLAAPWSATTRVQIPTMIEPLRRIEAVLQRTERMRSQQIDVDLVVLQLEEGALKDAEAALAELEQGRRQLDRLGSLRAQVENLRRSVPSDADEQLQELLSELARVERTAADGDLDGAYEMLRRVGADFEVARRDANMTELESIRQHFKRLGSRPNEAELALQLEDLRANPARKFPAELLDDARHRLEQVHGEVERRATALIDEIRDRFDVARRDLESSAEATIQSLLDSAVKAKGEGDPLTAESEVLRARDALDRHIVPTWTVEQGEQALLSHMIEYLRDSVAFAESDIRRLFVSCKTRRFVVLSGLTGSGKSTIARLFAESLDATVENKRFVRVAVRPNWVDGSEVLGYVNPITNRFEPGWMASLMSACEREPDLPFFCLLDEMNLAPVEQYLADILSAMEEAYVSRVPVWVQLYSPGSEPTNKAVWPSEMPFPANLFLIGTVNVDESTRGLSDRVLDRANVIQLSVEIGREHHMVRPVERRVQRKRVRMRDWTAVCKPVGTDSHHDFLVEIGEVFTAMRIGLGVRSHIEIERFLANAEAILPVEEALDLALLQRAVPKIRGFKRELEVGLQKLRELAESRSAERTVSVLTDWLSDEISSDTYLDGTDTRVGLVTSY